MILNGFNILFHESIHWPSSIHGVHVVQKNRLELVVQSVRALTPEVREYVLVSADGQRLPAYEAGAHVALHVEVAGQTKVRHYSLVGGAGTAADGRQAYRIAVKRESDAGVAAHLHAQCQVGSALTVSHPRNHFALDHRDHKSLLIAGGIGITPVIAMVRSLVQRQRDFEVLYLGRTAREMAYLSDLEALAGERLHVHGSAEHASQRMDLNAWLGARRSASTLYVCGPSSLVQEAQRCGTALGWRADQVRSKVFVAPTPYGAQGFELVLHKSGLTLQVPPQTSILEALQSAGQHPLFDCRQGMCGVCPLPVLEADGPLLHRDAYLSADEKSAGASLCICVSRLQGSRLVLNA
jgi:dimethylamine monooxygenase subunit B